MQKGTSKQIISDCNRIRQILINLIANAVKFTFKGSIQVLIKNISPELLEFSVTDSGTGISKNNQSKLFEAFSKLDDPNNQNVQGVGLGLMISNILAQKLSNSNQGLSV